MEIVLLWLDNLDDLIFACVLAANRMSKAFLGVGFAASLVLLIGRFSSVAVEWSLVPMGIAALCVGLWGIAATVDFVQKSRRHSGIA